MAFDAIICEMLRFLKEHAEDLENSDARDQIALVLSRELMINSDMGHHDFCEHVSKQIMIKLVEWMEQNAEN